MIMRIFLNRIKNFSIKELLFIVLTLHGVIFILAEISSFPFVMNLRSQFYLASPKPEQNTYIHHTGFVPQLEKCLQEPSCKLRNITIADDIGPGLIFWLSNKISPLNDSTKHLNPKAFGQAKNHPLASRIFYIFTHLSFIFLLVVISKNIFGTIISLLISISLCLFENFFSISYSNDVYFFPIYVIIVCLGLLNAHQNNKKTSTYLALGVLAGVLCWFRSSSWYIFLFFSLSLSFFFFLKNNYNFHRGIVFSLLACFLTFKAPLLVFDKPQHIFWHTLHAGLFEKGGILTTDNEFIPHHLASTISRDKIIGATDSWMDFIQIQTVQRKKPKTLLYSDEYEHILKKDYFRLLKLNIYQNIIFYLKRIPLVLSFNPFKEHLSSGEINYNSWNTFLGYTFIFLFYIFLMLKEISFIIKISFVSLLVGSMLPSVLVHANYIIYNAPILFSQWLILYLLFTIILNKIFNRWN